MFEVQKNLPCPPHTHTTITTTTSKPTQAQKEMDSRGIEPRTTPMLREYYTTKPRALVIVVADRTDDHVTWDATESFYSKVKSFESWLTMGFQPPESLWSEYWVVIGGDCAGGGSLIGCKSANSVTECIPPTTPPQISQHHTIRIQQSVDRIDCLMQLHVFCVS
jgi:hypothetical protein